MKNMKRWEVIINGVSYRTGDRKYVLASQMYTAVSRCLKSHFKKYPKQRFSKADIYVVCLGEDKSGKTQ